MATEEDVEKAKNKVLAECPRARAERAEGEFRIACPHSLEFSLGGSQSSYTSYLGWGRTAGEAWVDAAGRMFQFRKRSKAAR